MGSGALEFSTIEIPSRPTRVSASAPAALTGLELSGSFKDGAFVGLLSAYAEKDTQQYSEGGLFDILTLSTEAVE